MSTESLPYLVFLIFTGAAIFATAALFARQALIVSYIVLGVVLGPSLLGWVTDASLIKGVADIGIMFLLFLLGLNMHPQKLLRLLRSASIITGVNTPKLTKPLSVTDAQKAGFKIYKRTGKGEYVRQ